MTDAILTVPQIGRAEGVPLRLVDTGAGYALAVSGLAAAGGGFPAVALLDDFNRANAADLGANWDTDPLSFGDLTAILSGNAAAVPDDVNFGCNAWNPDTYGPDVAVCVTIGAAASGENWGVTLYARVVDSTHFYYFGTGTGGNAYLGNGAGESITPDITLDTPLGLGDKIGLVCRGSAIEGWVYQSGAWTKVIEGTDGTTSAAGQLMFEITDDGAGGGLALDNFSAADLSVTRATTSGDQRVTTGGDVRSIH